MPITSTKLSHLPLRPSTLTTLQKRGFVTTSEIEESKRGGGISNLAAELGCNLSEAASLAREVESAVSAVRQGGGTPGSNSGYFDTTSPSVTAASLLSHQTRGSMQRQIVTFSRSIDSLLGGGMNLAEVTEVVGLPGVGKTQLAMQLCVDARIPKEHGGVGGEAVYIDSEGSFSPERCQVMAEALVNHVRNSAQRRRKSSANAPVPLPQSFEMNTILSGIHVFRVHDEAAQTAAIYSLQSFLQKRAKTATPVRLVVIDSIAFHYRCAGSDYMARTQSLAMIAAFLADLAVNCNVAVVAINQMTTKVGASKSDSSDDSRLVPALGESWAHATTTRLLLSRTDDGSRRCTLVKSPHKAAGTALYQVLESGIRDISRGTNTAVGNVDPSKRPRRQY